jgi:hypothetical protein
MVGKTFLGKRTYARVRISTWAWGVLIDSWFEKKGLPNGVRTTCTLQDKNTFEWKNVRLVVTAMDDIASDYKCEEDETHISIGYYVEVLEKPASRYH